MSKRINVSELEPVIGTLYPSPFDQTSRARERTKLGDQEGLTQLGVNFLRLPPGVWSGQRHWHTLSDEFFYVLAGEVVLVTDEGEEIFHAGDAAGFKAGDPDGHSFQNRSDADVLMLEIGTRNDEDVGQYPDIDLVARMDGVPAFYTHKDGTPYLDIRRRGPKDD